ncbi:MAG: type II toxin-antitoxin system mRNA interferase toxin, RelE/StbE family [Candidatus Hydrogenedentes bacterium]|nr:type II toxin-antitoxin system mRNA interferase toxin, RelE/StbE family [Candidatus Hydrogenedentota bacterium]
MDYKVEISRRARRDLRALHVEISKRIDTHILALANDPRPAGSQKLAGHATYRIRVGDYRILYEIYDKKLVVVVIRAGHRKEIYR